MSEPAPVPKPRLLLAEVMPPLPAPTLDVISERSACESAPTAPDRFFVCASGVRSICSRRSASSSLNWLSCFCAFSCASCLRSTGGGDRNGFFSGSTFGFCSTFGTGGGGGGGFGFSSIITRARRCGTSVSAAVRFGVRQQRKQNAEHHEQDEQHPQDLAEARARLGIAFPGQLVLAVKRRVAMRHARAPVRTGLNWPATTGFSFWITASEILP